MTIQRPQWHNRKLIRETKVKRFVSNQYRTLYNTGFKEMNTTTQEKYDKLATSML